MKELMLLQFTIFILVSAGVIVKKTGIIGREGQKNITNLVIYVVLPCNIVMSFLNGNPDRGMNQCIVILLVSLVIQIFCVLYGKVVYAREKGGEQKCLKYGIICSNAGFLGNPVAEGIFGSVGLMLASIYLIPQRIMMWSEGIHIFSNDTDKKQLIKKVITHPCVLACMLGMCLMYFSIPVPDFLLSPIKAIGRCNTAMSMMVIGMILSEIDLKNFADKKVIRFTVERLIVIPLLVLLGCKAFRIDSLVTNLSVILAAMPAGATTSMLAEKYDQNPEFATKLVIFSTICSIPSICIWSMILL